MMSLKSISVWNLKKELITNITGKKEPEKLLEIKFKKNQSPLLIISVMSNLNILVSFVVKISTSRETMVLRVG